MTLLRICVDGDMADPERVIGGNHWFTVKLPVRTIRLVSASARPVDLGINKDQRRFGVRVLGIRIAQKDQSAELPLASDAFSDGFHPLVNGKHRTTNGDALVPPALVPLWTGQAKLCVRTQPTRFTAWHYQTSQTGEVRELVGGFESLGHNCALAQLQRHVGSGARIGLLSWARIDTQRLADALDSGFDGVGDIAKSRLVRIDNEYRIETPWLLTHTRQYKQVDAETEQQILAAGCARLRLLRRKLLADLASAKRVFVHTAPKGTLPESRMMEIHAAVRRHGPVRLLCITSGRLQPVRPGPAEGLYMAGLSRFVGQFGPFDEWINICKGARDLDDAQTGRGRGSSGPL